MKDFFVLCLFVRRRRLIRLRWMVWFCRWVLLRFMLIDGEREKVDGQVATLWGRCNCMGR